MEHKEMKNVPMELEDNALDAVSGGTDIRKNKQVEFVNAVLTIARGDTTTVTEPVDPGLTDKDEINYNEMLQNRINILKKDMFI